MCCRATELNFNSNGPASEALELVLKLSCVVPVHVKKETKKMIDTKRLKRQISSMSSTSSMETFDLSSIAHATQPVEDSIAFPEIAWSNDTDTEISDSCEDSCPFMPSPKRICRGLVRSKKLGNLSSLASLS